MITETPLAPETLVFLDAIWRRYAAADALRLDRIIARRGEGEEAIRLRHGSEVTIAAMQRMFARDAAPRPAASRTMRSHTGRAVTVQKWVPGRKSPAA